MSPTPNPSENKDHQTLQNAKKLAFISVFDKTGIDTVAKALVEQYDYTILSTGGTKKFLAEKNIPVVEASSITGFDELLGGRVKSLHPNIFAPILAERDKKDDDNYAMPEFLVDTVIVNLYPFEKERDEQTLVPKGQEADPNHLLHFIDIGGSALIRAAAKNYPSVNVLCDAEQYDDFLTALKNGKGETNTDYRRTLALAAFQRSTAYESAITRHIEKQVKESAPSDTGQESTLDSEIVLPLKKIQDLRYGENPYQQAALYGLDTTDTDFTLLHGKELSFNNILDMQAAWGVVSEFNEHPTCAVIKHNNPCGVAVSNRSLEDAYNTAFNADSLSAFGGVVALNQIVDEATAKLMKEVFLEVIIAPGFSEEAKAVLMKKKNLRLVERHANDTSNPHSVLDIKQVSGTQFLIQAPDPHKETRIDALFTNELLEVVTEKKPTEEELRSMVFAWKVVKHVKSNAIVLAQNGRTVGIGAGQTSRIGALENALKLACDEAKGAVLASDGFFPQVDNIHAAAQARVSSIIQPGGSIKDKDVIDTANKYGMAMVLTGLREFRH